MNKKIFPGGQTKQMRDQQQERQREYRAQQQAAKAREKERKREQKKEEKAKKQEFLKKIGPSTRLLIARRGFTTFVAVMMLEVGFGSSMFLFRNNDSKPEANRRSYIEALKSVYNITNLADNDKWILKENDFASDAIETLVATLLALVAAGFACRNIKRDQLTAKRTANLSPFFNMSSLYYIKNDIHHIPVKKEITWKLHPISRQIIKHIAANNPTLFNELISGKVSDASRDYTLAVIKAHLKSHPEDFKKVLDVYEEESLPKSLTRKYCQRVH